MQTKETTTYLLQLWKRWWWWFGIMAIGTWLKTYTKNQAKKSETAQDDISYEKFKWNESKWQTAALFFLPWWIVLHSMFVCVCSPMFGTQKGNFMVHWLEKLSSYLFLWCNHLKSVLFAWAFMFFALSLERKLKNRNGL